MSFIKLGEITEINGVENTASCIPLINTDILEQFKKTAISLKKIAPKAEDFLYFSAVMMHAAEASSINDDGSPKLNSKGEAVTVGWDKRGDTWRWTSNDKNISAYKNSNGDIFPEEELLKAYKKWIHKPLCIDHESSSVDHVRGFIVDTYYDHKLKRVIALCALDKHNYPDLARKVSTGYSNCVSMGTAVGKAICYDCGRVAKAEPDFCDHMKKKTCYGEINIDLNPIELSIVVNGADGKAHIKDIIASANTLNAYVDNKSKELNKLADRMYNATISYSGIDGNTNGGNATISVESKDLEDFKSEIDKAFDKLKEISSTSEETSNNLTSFDNAESSGSENSGLGTPERFASERQSYNKDSFGELNKVTASIEAKLNVMKESLDKLTNNASSKQEENMSANEINKRSYFQGGGGVNEPTPGQVKYLQDPSNEKLRTEDKQMVGQMDTGPVDGMHPGPDSVGMSELERKKMLARAESEERAIRRTAIVNLAKQALEDKKGYFQGGGGVNEPSAPGKPKYPVDKLNEDARDEDKQMVGQKPFPGVGNVDGLHPSPSSADIADELKRKEMLRRASLRARFVKASNTDGTQNLGKSGWEVFLGDKLLLSASVDELSGGNTGMLYDSIATKDFGTKLIEKIKVQGADKVRSLVKKAQDPAAVAPVAPPAEEPASPDAPADLPAEDTGKSGDPKKTALELAEKVRDLGSDLTEAVRALTGEQAEMGAMESATPEMATAASDNFSTASLNKLRKELNGALTHAMKEAVAELNDHGQELDMIANMYDTKGTVNSGNSELVGSIVGDALNEAKTSIADGFKLMTAFVKYARGTKAIVKRAQMEAELDSLSNGDNMEHETGDSDNDLMSLINDTNADLNDVKELMDEDDLSDLDGLNDEDGLEEAGADDNDAGLVTTHSAEQAAQVSRLDPNAVVKVEASFNSREGRAVLRAKLAADALGKEDNGELQDMTKAKFNSALNEADSLADGQLEFDVKPSNDLGRVETLPEQNKKMLEIAKAAPKVRKEAEAIHRLVSEGKLDPADLDALVAEGLDKDAVAYWKKYYGQADGGSEFASELVKEHVKADMEKELNVYKIKLARSYELAYEMVDKGLCLNDRNAISTEVESIMKHSDESFESLKRVVAKHGASLSKQAGHMPQVTGDVYTTNGGNSNDDWSELSAALSKSSKRLF